MLRAVLEYQHVPEDTIQRMMFGDLKEVPSPYLGGKSFREATQTLGTEWGREKINPDFWINCVGRKLHHTKPSHVAVSDVRFPNEGSWIHRNGGMLVRIGRRTSLNQYSQHISETLVDSLNVDLELDNIGSKQDFYNKLNYYIQDISWIGIFRNFWTRILR
jgi:hypothetical protein